ncbi:hypothetical protein [Flavobacterium sp.]|uniref:hypothetical protein n=1 Tax=Flavobacterium sp. TaxID=239 RepID=UPI0026155FA3|nr:hypothetical protein [Flavobacterium sp.]
MKYSAITYILGVLTVIGFFLTYLIERQKENKLIPITCKVLNYECSGRAANTSFIFNDKVYAVGGAPEELCDNNNAKKNYATFYYYKNSDSFYLTNSTNSKVYLYFAFGGFLIFMIPFLLRKIDRLVWSKELKKSK